jgi:hypothetical protein
MNVAIGTHIIVDQFSFNPGLNHLICTWQDNADRPPSFPYWSLTYQFGVGWNLSWNTLSASLTWRSTTFGTNQNPIDFTLTGSTSGCTGVPPVITLVPLQTPTYCCSWCSGVLNGQPNTMTLHSYYACVGQACFGPAVLGPPTVTPCPCMVNASQPNGFPATLTYDPGGNPPVTGSWKAGHVPTGCGTHFSFRLYCGLRAIQGSLGTFTVVWAPYLDVTLDDCFETTQSGQQYNAFTCAGLSIPWGCPPTPTFPNDALDISFGQDMHGLPTPYVPNCCPTMLCNGCNQFNGCQSGNCDLFYNGHVTA